MADNTSRSSNADSDSFLQEELAHVEELLISSREECIEIGEKYQNLSLQVESLINLQEEHVIDSVDNEQASSENDMQVDFEEHLSKYESRISAYKKNQEHQSRIVNELQNHVEEYRIRCAKLEAALAEHSANEANIVDSDSHSQSAFQMDLETTLIRLEQEKNRCQGLTQINNLLREQLETATEVNQTLTSDVQRLTKEWQQARSELLAKETEWKEEEQTFSIYYTKKSNLLLSLWREILNFKHDFGNLKSQTERELSSFKGCICNNIQKITDLQFSVESKLKNEGTHYDLVTEKVTSLINEQKAQEISKLQDRINELIDRNERIQVLLDEKEKTNSALCNTVEKINESLQAVTETDYSCKTSRNDKLVSKYISAFKDMYYIISNDTLWDSSSTHTLLLEDIFNDDSDPDSENLHLHSFVSSVKNLIQRYHKQIEDNNMKLTSLKEQNQMQQRTVEFLEDERHKMQQLNSQLSSQFETLNQKMQDLFQDIKSGDGSAHTASLETMVKSLKEQVENLNFERDRLLNTQEELYSKLQNANEEKRLLKQKELSLNSEVDKNVQKSSELERQVESLKEELLETKKHLDDITFDKELLEQEKLKFSNILSNLENQSLELKESLTKLREEEYSVKESLVTMQNLCENLSLEKSDLSRSLNEVMAKLESLQSLHSNTKIAFEKEKIEMKLKMEKLEDLYSEVKNEKENLISRIHLLETSKRDIEEEKNQISISNNELTNQVAKYSSQIRNFEAELGQLREDLKHQEKLVFETNEEKNSLIRIKSELSVKLESVEEEIAEFKETLTALKEEKVILEKDLYACQTSTAILRKEKADVVRELDLQRSQVLSLQDQIKKLEQMRGQFMDTSSYEKDTLLRKMERLEEDFKNTLQNERQQHSLDIEILNEEKESLRGRLVSAVDELCDRHQKQQEDLINFHQAEIETLKKKISTIEAEYEEKIIQLQSGNKKIHSDYKLEISSLSHDVESLKNKLSNNEEIIKDLESKLLLADEERNSILHNNLEAAQKLKEEIQTMSTRHSNTVKELDNRIKTLKEEKEIALNEMNQLESKLKHVEFEKSKLAEELEEANFTHKSEQSIKTHLEDKIALIQNQLKEEKTLNDTISKSLDDCKQRLKVAQTDNLEMKQQIDETLQKLKDLETSTAKIRSQNNNLRDTLKEVEMSRLEMKREVSTLKRNIGSLEKSLEMKEQEINELSMLHSREEEIQEELRQEIVQLKQKMMQSNATNEALVKELANSRNKLADLEQKLKMQEQQHQKTLQECLSSELNLSEHRLNLEKSMSDTARELQTLRSNLNYEEGKVLGLESKIAKLDSAKREVENKLFSICLFLRSILGLGSDSGFLSVNSNLQFNSSRKGSSEKLNEQSSMETSSQLNFSKYNSPAHFSVSELDIELLKSSLKNFIQKFNATEKERDNLKDSLLTSQKEEEEIRNEHSKCITRIYQLQIELDDKKNIENELASKIANIHHCEEIIHNLEREKRRLKEQMGNAEFSSSSVIKEKGNLLDNIAELKRNELKLQEQIRVLSAAKESAESKADKYIELYKSLESDMVYLRESIANKELEMKSLEQMIESSNKKLQSSEAKIKSLKATVEQLKNTIQKHVEKEEVLQNKISEATSQTSTSHQNLYEEIERMQKERQKHQSNLFTLQQSSEQLRGYVDEYKLKNKFLKDEVEDLKNKLTHSEEVQQNLLVQMKSLQSVLQRTQKLEKDAVEESSKLHEEKEKLEAKVANLSASVRNSKIVLEEKEEICQKLEKEKFNLKKSLDKFEKEKQRNSELTAKSIMDKSAFGRALKQMEIENQSLQQKVQNLQAQLAESEERHAQRVKDFLKSQSFESKLEDNRLRTALKQAEQLMEKREKMHRQKILGLEEQISVLKSNLEKDQQRWRQFHQRSLNANSDINYLHSVLSKSLQNVSDDPQKLLPEAERLDLTTETELSASPGTAVSTPSKLRQATPRRHMTSTPKAKKRLDLSPSQL